MNLIIILILAILPFVILGYVASDTGSSNKHVYWGFLGWIGVIIGLVLMYRGRNARRQSVASTTISPQSSGRYCSSCGSPNETDAKFCARCGTAMRS